MIGIYRILNLNTSKSYVGSAVDIKKRWSGHLLELRKNVHHSPKLQNSWNKHGKDAFRFEVLQECEEDRLNWLEAFWSQKLDAVNNGYCMIALTLDGERVVRRHHPESRKLLKLAGKKNWSLNRESMTAKAIERGKDPEFLKKLSRAGKITWEVKRELLTQKCHERCATEEFREKLRKAGRGFHNLPSDHPSKLQWIESMKKNRNTEEYKEDRRRKMLKLYEDHPELRELVGKQLNTLENREKLKKRLNDPDVKAKLKAPRHTTPESRQRLSDNIREYYDNRTEEERLARNEKCKWNEERFTKFAATMAGKLWWKNEELKKATKSLECPGEGWVRGKKLI
jgi:group I intron endonuclease